MYSIAPNYDVEEQLMHTRPIMTPVTLPNLHFFTFKGYSTYLSALVHRITTPRLEKFKISYLDPIPFPLPHILQFMNTIENPKFDCAKFEFFKGGGSYEVLSP
jgi:hypothetical protein